LAKVLATPAAHIRVIATPVGGGFGGKTDPFSHEIVACQLSKLTGRPVKIALTREEVFYTHRGRHPVLMWIKTGFTKRGDITGCGVTAAMGSRPTGGSREGGAGCTHLVQPEPPSPKKPGIGIACSAYMTGAGTAIYWNDMPHSGVIVRADRSGGVAILCGATD